MISTQGGISCHGIDITQGAAHVIGHNMGTAVTAAIEGIGAGNAALRTGVAQINIIIGTGLIALVLLYAD